MSGQGLHQLKNTSQKLIKVRDGLLDPHEFTAVRDSLISEESLMPWYFSEGIDYGPEEKNFMFFHVCLPVSFTVCFPACLRIRRPVCLHLYFFCLVPACLSSCLSS